jgi:hypothetical protein
MMAGFAAANTVWNPTDPNASVTGVSNWNIAANWSNGLPGDIDQKPVFNAAGASVECQVTTDTLPFSSNLVMGDGGDAGILRIMNGGKITKTGGQWCGLGYNADGGTMIVEKGGEVILNSHLWFGAATGGVGRLILNGGYVRVADAIDLGCADGTLGFLTINDGTFRFRYYPDNSDSEGSLCDIRFGTLAIENNYATAPSPLWDRINAGTIVGFGGLGTLTVTRESVDGTNLTLVRANSPLNPNPAYKETVLGGDVELAWTNLEPHNPGDSVYVDVWFGTDPNKLSLAYSQVVTAGENTQTVMVSAPVIGNPPTTYYWQVDSYIHGADSIHDPNKMIEGDVFQFDVTNVLPPMVSITTPSMITWKNEPVQLNTQLLQGSENVTYTWTSSIPDPNIIFSPSNTDPNPTVTVDYHSAQFTVTVTVDDEFPFNAPHAATLQLDCADNPCQAARSIGIGAQYAGDITVDCKVNLTDFARIAREWLTDYALTGPVAFPAP